MEQKENEVISAEDIQVLDSIYNENREYDSIMIYLQKIQSALGYVPEYAIKYLASKTKASESHMFGVITFYSQFSTKPVGKNIIKICNGTACHVGGSKVLGKKLKAMLNVDDENPTTEDRLFTVQPVACLGCCALAPAMMVNDKVYGTLTVEKMKDIIETYKKGSENGDF
ncbi:MAG: NAD(P)H-dependent oxidoreductase subunit E [Acidobacteriota bacterium]